MAAAIVAAAVVLITGEILGFTLWHCPIESATGLPCPGCGFTRAVHDLVLGQWTAAWRHHPFVYPLAGGLLLLTIALVLPERPRKRLIRAVRQLEVRTGFSLVMLTLLLLFWLLRLGGVTP